MIKKLVKKGADDEDEDDDDEESASDEDTKTADTNEVRNACFLQLT